MGNSRTSRYADGRTIYDLNHATASWLRSLAANSHFELTTPSPAGITARRGFGPRRLEAVREALLRTPRPQMVSARRGAGEVQRMLMDPDISPRLRRLARSLRHDEGDVAAIWARLRVHAPGLSTVPVSEAGAT